MIIEHVSPSEGPAHNFVISQTGLDIHISQGVYHDSEKVVYESETGGTISIPVFEEDTYIELWVNGEGLHIIASPAHVPSFLDYSLYVDKLMYAIIPANTTSLDGVEINVIRMVLTDAN